MILASTDKELRARKVVEKPTLFDPESVEAKALSIVNARGEKLSAEDKVVEVYKILGGLLLTEKEAEALKESKRKK